MITDPSTFDNKRPQQNDRMNLSSEIVHVIVAVSTKAKTLHQAVRSLHPETRLT